MPMLYPRRSGKLTNPLGLMLIGLLLAVGGVVILPLTLPSALAEERAYRSAPECPDSVTAPNRAGECRDRREATVVEREVAGEGDNKRYYVVLDVDGEPYRVRLTSGRSDIDAFDPGDEVTVTAWRQRIREVEVGGESIRLHGTPIGAYKAPLMGSVAFLAFGFALLWMARFERRLRRSGRSIESLGSWTATVPAFTAMVFAIVAMIPIAAPSDLTGSLIALGCTAIGMVLVGSLFWRRQRRKAERRSAELLAATWVRPPEVEAVVPARVLGEVPYSRGDPYLVVGPAGLAAAFDAGGRAGRTPPFPPLVFVRLHRAAKRDARLGLIEDPVLVECRDGEREVLIGVGRAHLPWVLGGLRFPQR